MPAGVFSIGKDVTLDISTSLSGVLSLPVTVNTFEAKPQFNKIRQVGLDGVNRGANVPTGWEGTITLDRANDVIDAFFADAEAGYYSGSTNPYTAQITETITEADGTTSQYRYTPVQLALDEAGSYAGDKQVSQTISFFASKKLKVA